MKALVYKENRPPNNFQLGETENLNPKDYEVLVKVNEVSGADISGRVPDMYMCYN